MENVIITNAFHDIESALSMICCFLTLCTVVSDHIYVFVYRWKRHIRITRVQISIQHSVALAHFSMHYGQPEQKCAESVSPVTPFIALMYSGGSALEQGVLLHPRLCLCALSLACNKNCH